jgi:hypothetical protein
MGQDLRCIWRHEGGIRQNFPAGIAEADKILAIGAIPMQEHDKLSHHFVAWLAAGSIELAHVISKAPLPVIRAGRTASAL